MRLLTLLFLLAFAIPVLARNGPIVCDPIEDECNNDDIPTTGRPTVTPPPEPIEINSAAEFCFELGCVLLDVNAVTSKVIVYTTERDIFNFFIFSDTRSAMAYSITAALITKNEYKIRRSLRSEELQKDIDKLESEGYEFTDYLKCITNGVGCGQALQSVRSPWGAALALVTCFSLIVECRQLDLEDKQRLEKIDKLKAELNKELENEANYNSWEPADLPAIPSEPSINFGVNGIECFAETWCLNGQYCQKITTCEAK
ncbi:MAG: hypothetical protein HRU19_24710 [Pseudobacteriovorax sp.]|nr:hypothetical protein [Pseudobacteriovorax sp.]